MKRKLLYGLLAGTIISLFQFSNVSALTIVDTGIPVNTDTQYSFHGNPISEVWHAGQFTLDQSYSLTDIELYLTPKSSGIVTVAIYSGSDTPILGTSLFEDTFVGVSSGPVGWYGLHGINWTLSAGTFWVAFEAREQDYYYSTLPSEVPFPMDAYAFYNPVMSEDYILAVHDFGVRISADPDNPIPEPTTILLLGVGLAGISAFNRRKL